MDEYYLIYCKIRQQHFLSINQPNEFNHTEGTQIMHTHFLLVCQRTISLNQH